MKNLIIASLLLIAGCATTTTPAWTHATKSEADLKADSQECRSAHAGLLATRNADAEMIYRVRVEDCMKAKGYSRTTQ